MTASVRTCRVCGCTDRDCRQCIQKTGTPCHWVDVDLCSACEGFCIDGAMEDDGKCNMENSGCCGEQCFRDEDKCGLWTPGKDGV